MYQGWIPFNKFGEHLEWVSETPPDSKDFAIQHIVVDSRLHGAIHWWANEVFEDTFEIVGYGRGRSAVSIRLKSVDGWRICSVSLATLMGWIDAERIVGKRITGKFCFAKRGQNYKLEDFDG